MPKTPVIPEKLGDEIVSIYNEFLAEWELPAEEIMVPTRYGATHVTTAGPKDGAVVVLLHGMGFPAPLTWVTLAPLLGASHRLIAPDTVGDVGKSVPDGETSRPRSGADYSHWLDDVLTGLSADDGRVAIVGISYGAWIGLHYCLNAPERVERLALMSPMGLAPWSVLIKLMAKITRLFVQLRHDPDEGAKWFLRDRDDLRELVAPWMRLSMQCRPKLGPPLPIPTSKLRGISVPVLVAVGAIDPILGAPGPMLRRAREMPNVTIELLQDAGHALIVEAPDRMNDLLTGFLH